MANSRSATRLAMLLVAVVLGGCVASGAIYSHTTRPLMTNFDATPVADSGGSSDVKTVAFYVDVKWGDGGISAIAREKGIAEIYYADIQTTTILGYWQQDYVRIYGRPLVTDASQPALGVSPPSTLSSR